MYVKISKKTGKRMNDKKYTIEEIRHEFDMLNACNNSWGTYVGHKYIKEEEYKEPED